MKPRRQARAARGLLRCHRSTLRDVPLLASLNRQLIEDEHSETRLSLDDLEARMRGWLTSEYSAALFQSEGKTVAYALYRPDAEGIYLRQFFVTRAMRRRGVGRRAIQLLLDTVWPGNAAIFLDVLMHNQAGLDFWKATGFADYSLTLALAPAAPRNRVRRPSKPRRALIALGSNLGDSAALLRAAMDRLDRLAALPLRRSSLWSSTPVDCLPGSPGFVNAAVLFEPATDETPETLLARLRALEKEFGRQHRGVRNAPRPLDLDLIAFGDEVRATAALTLPHPRAHLRRFVLAPLAEIAPDAVLPGRRSSVRQLLRRLESEEVVVRLR